MNKFYEREQFIKVQDSRSSIRRGFLKKWFSNNYDVLRFFYFLAQQTRVPIIGAYFFRPIMESYYHNFHPGSFILPRKEIEAVINNSTALSIDPCICRILNSNCDSPLYTCLRINFSAKVRQEETGRSINKDEALEIIKNARKHGMILSLEHCIRPYHYNICMCCSCCCVPKQFRYEFGLDVYRNGPYVPDVDKQRCQLCKKCENKCPVSAIFEKNGEIGINIQECLGCGICEDTCPNEVIKMIKKREICRDENEPSTINLYLKRVYLELIMVPLVFVFKFLMGSQQYIVENIEPREKDIYGKMNIGNLQHNKANSADAKRRAAD